MPPGARIARTTRWGHLGWGAGAGHRHAAHSSDATRGGAARLSDRLYSGGPPEGVGGFRELQRLGIRSTISVDGMQPDVDLACRLGCARSTSHSAMTAVLCPRLTGSCAPHATFRARFTSVTTTANTAVPPPRQSLGSDWRASAPRKRFAKWSDPGPERSTRDYTPTCAGTGSRPPR
jgi:hypothetical protein